MMVGTGVGVGLEGGAGVHAPRISNAVMSKTAIICILMHRGESLLPLYS